MSDVNPMDFKVADYIDVFIVSVSRDEPFTIHIYRVRVQSQWYGNLNHAIMFSIVLQSTFIAPISR